MNEKPVRELYLDAIRAVSTMAVILLHISAQNFRINPHEPKWSAFNMIDSGFRWAVPAFLMISGAVFLEKNIAIKAIFRKYVFRIALAYVFWSAVYTFFYKLHNNSASTKDIIRTFLLGHYHMWFLPMIAGIYLVLPLIKSISQEELTEKWFIILGFIFAIALPQLSALSPYFLSKGRSDLIANLIAKPQIKLVQGYAFYFLLGHYLSRKKLSVPRYHKLITATLWLAGLLGWATTFLLTKYLSIKSNKAIDILYGNFSINVLLEAIFVFCILKSLFYEKRQDKRVSRFLRPMINFLSQYSFGVYLVHPLFIEEIKRVLGVDTLSFESPIAGVFILFAVVYVLSYATSIIIKNLPYIGKYIA